MINDVVSAVISSLKLKAGLTDKTIVRAYDQSADVAAAAGTVIEVAGSSEVKAADATGKPLAWDCNLAVKVATHDETDKSGATRRQLVGHVFDWFMALSAGGLTITGYTLNGIMSVRESDTMPLGDEYISQDVMGTIVIVKN